MTPGFQYTSHSASSSGQQKEHIDKKEFFSFHLTQLLECIIQQLIVGLEVAIEMKGITLLYKTEPYSSFSRLQLW